MSTAEARFACSDPEFSGPPVVITCRYTCSRPTGPVETPNDQDGVQLARRRHLLLTLSYHSPTCKPARSAIPRLSPQPAAPPPSPQAPSPKPEQVVAAR